MTKGFVISFYDFSGNMLKPWADAGYQCFAFDIKHKKQTRTDFIGEGSITFIRQDLYNPCFWPSAEMTFYKKTKIVFGFPPCTDLAVSGAKHFERKEKENPGFQDFAVARAIDIARLAETIGAPYMIENPVSVLATKWRKPSFYFEPYEYGKYIPEAEAEHPRWPQYFPAHDAYTKKTGIWSGNGFVQPEKKPVDLPEDYSGSEIWKKLGGKSEKTKEIRSETPRGFAQAVFEANS